jgi:hypothetical protein
VSFTTVTITHSFLNADGTPGSGEVKFTLTQRMTNGSQSVLPASVTASLNGTGNLSASLWSNSDTGTSPTGAQYRVDMLLQGASEEQFFITVPSGVGTVDLGGLLPAAEQVE